MTEDMRKSKTLCAQKENYARRHCRHASVRPPPPPPACRFRAFSRYSLFCLFPFSLRHSLFWSSAPACCRLPLIAAALPLNAVFVDHHFWIGPPSRLRRFFTPPATTASQADDYMFSIIHEDMLPSFSDIYRHHSRDREEVRDRKRQAERCLFIWKMQQQQSASFFSHGFCSCPSPSSQDPLTTDATMRAVCRCAVRWLHRDIRDNRVFSPHHFHCFVFSLVLLMLPCFLTMPSLLPFLSLRCFLY